YQSTDTLKDFNGSKMTPNVAFCDSTAFKFGLAPSTPVAGDEHRALNVPFTFATALGQRTGSLVLPWPNASPAVPDSAMDGARNPLPHVPRIVNSSIGVNLIPTFGVAEPP